MNQDQDFANNILDYESINHNDFMNQDPLKPDWDDELNNFNDPV